MTVNEKVAILLIAHGSRRQAANDDLAKLAELIREKQNFDLTEIAYLELAEPTIPQGARACVSGGASRVMMFPYFLSAGNHVHNDLEQHRLQFLKEFPGVSFLICPPLGVHPLMIEIVLDRISEGLQKIE